MMLSIYHIHSLVFNGHGDAEHVLSLICVHHSKVEITIGSAKLVSSVVSVYGFGYINVLLSCDE